MNRLCVCAWPERARELTWNAMVERGDVMPLYRARGPSVFAMWRRSPKHVVGARLGTTRGCWRRIRTVSRGCPATTPAMPPTPPATNSRPEVSARNSGQNSIAPANFSSFDEIPPPRLNSNKLSTNRTSKRSQQLRRPLPLRKSIFFSLNSIAPTFRGEIPLRILVARSAWLQIDPIATLLFSSGSVVALLSHQCAHRDWNTSPKVQSIPYFSHHLNAERRGLSWIWKSWVSLHHNPLHYFRVRITRCHSSYKGLAMHGCDIMFPLIFTNVY